MQDTQKLLAGALLAGAALLTGSTALITVAGGVGVNWSSEALWGLWDARDLRLQGDEPLARAYREAIESAIRDLRRQYAAESGGRTPLAAFDLVAACARDLGSAQFPPTLDVAAVQGTLDEALDRLLFGHDPQQAAFLRARLLPAVARAFRLQMAGDDRAWRRYHGRLIEQMAAASARAASTPGNAPPGAPAGVEAAPMLTAAELDTVRAALADAAAAQADLRASAARLDELIRAWQETAAQGQGGRAVTFDNKDVHADTLVQGGERAYSQSAHSEGGGTANVTTINISGAVPPEVLAALLGGRLPPAANPPPGQGAGQPPTPTDTLGPPAVGPAPAQDALPPTLTGPQREELQEALLSAFTLDTLRRMVRFGLDESLEQIAGPGNLRAVVFDLVDWAQREGRLPDLLQAAHKAAPGNARLNAFLRGLAGP